MIIYKFKLALTIATNHRLKADKKIYIYIYYKKPKNRNNVRKT